MPSRMCINPIHNEKGILHKSVDASSEERWAFILPFSMLIPGSRLDHIFALDAPAMMFLPDGSQFPISGCILLPIQFRVLDSVYPNKENTRNFARVECRIYLDKIECSRCGRWSSSGLPTEYDQGWEKNLLYFAVPHFCVLLISMRRGLPRVLFFASCYYVNDKNNNLPWVIFFFRWAANSCAMDSLYDLDLMSRTVPVILDNSRIWYHVISTGMKLGKRGLAHVEGTSRRELEEDGLYSNVLLINRTASPLSWYPSSPPSMALHLWMKNCGELAGSRWKLGILRGRCSILLGDFRAGELFLIMVIDRSQVRGVQGPDQPQLDQAAVFVPPADGCEKIETGCRWGLYLDRLTFNHRWLFQSWSPCPMLGADQEPPRRLRRDPRPPRRSNKDQEGPIRGRPEPPPPPGQGHPPGVHPGEDREVDPPRADALRRLRRAGAGVLLAARRQVCSRSEPAAARLIGGPMRMRSVPRRRYRMAYASNFSRILEPVVENNYQLFMIERLILAGARTFVRTFKEDEGDLYLTDDPKKNSKTWSKPVYTSDESGAHWAPKSRSLLDLQKVMVNFVQGPACRWEPAFVQDLIRTVDSLF